RHRCAHPGHAAARDAPARCALRPGDHVHRRRPGPGRGLRAGLVTPRPAARPAGGPVGMRIAVLGAGSWGTTVASLLAGRHDCTVWARDPELAREIYERDANSRYLPGFALPSNLKATADL